MNRKYESRATSCRMGNLLAHAVSTQCAIRYTRYEKMQNKPNFTPQNVEAKRRSASGGQNEPNMPNTQRRIMQNEPNSTNASSAGHKRPETRDERQVTINMKNEPNSNTERRKKCKTNPIQPARDEPQATSDERRKKSCRIWTRYFIILKISDRSEYILDAYEGY